MHFRCNQGSLYTAFVLSSVKGRWRIHPDTYYMRAMQDTAHNYTYASNRPVNRTSSPDPSRLALFRIRCLNRRRMNRSQLCPAAEIQGREHFYDPTRTKAKPRFRYKRSSSRRMQANLGDHPLTVHPIDIGADGGNWETGETGKSGNREIGKSGNREIKAFILFRPPTVVRFSSRSDVGRKIDAAIRDRLNQV